MSRPRANLTPEERASIRHQIRARHGSRCFYCRRHFRERPGRRETIDHFIPYTLWPTWDVKNLVLACERCNFRKDDALPLTLAWLLLQHADPFRDSYAPAA